MSIPAPHNAPFRMSLRELFLGVLFVAMAIVSLLYASPTWQIVMGLFLLFVFTGAIIAAIIDRGRGQSFAIGMVAAMTVYAAALIYARLGSDFNSELFSDDSARGRLPTTRLLRSLYAVIVDRKEILGEGAFRGTVVSTIEVPIGSAFMSVGHCWWALLLGYFGGRFATFLYLRRTKKPNR